MKSKIRGYHALKIAFASLATGMAPPSAAAPKVKAPGYAAIQRLCAKAGINGAKAHHRGLAVGQGRFVSVASTAKGIHLVVLVRRGTDWALSFKRQLEHADRADVAGRPPEEPNAAQELLALDQEGCGFRTSLFAKDYDKDGHAEVLVRYRYCWITPGLGTTLRRRMVLWNLDPKPSVAFETQLDHVSYDTAAYNDRSRARFSDLNDDGHPDLTIVTSSRTHDEHDRLKTTRRSAHYLWNPKMDRYQRSKAP